MDGKEEIGGCIYDDPTSPQMDWDSRYDTVDHAMMEFLTSFETTYKDRIDDIRDRVGRDRETAIEIFADELLEEKLAGLETKQKIIDFLNETI